MNYEVISQIYVVFLCLIFSGYYIYIGIRQIRRVPFIIRGLSNRAGRILSGIIIFSPHAINGQSHMFFLVIVFCILFLIVFFRDYRKFYQLSIHNIDEVTLKGLLEQYFEDKDFEFEIVDSPSLFDSLYNEVRIYKSKSSKNYSDFKKDFVKYIRPMKCKKFRVMGVFNTLLGVTFLFFFILIYI